MFLDVAPGNLLILMACLALGSQDLCTPGYSPENGVWHCLTNEDRALCYIACFPGYVPSNRSRTFCIAGVWNIPPDSLTCSPAASLIVGGSGSSTGQLYDQFGESINLPPIADHNGFTTADFVDGELVVCGHLHCLILDHVLWTWKEFPSPKLNHIGGTSSVSYSTLYLIGGETTAFEFYDSYEGSEWQLGGKISSSEIAGACAAPYSSSHLITGGVNTPQSAVLYNLIDGEHTVLPDMIYPSTGHGCVPCTDPVTGHYGVLVAGGRPFYRLVQFLDLNLREWREMASLQVDRADVSRMLVMDHKIYIFGGSDADGKAQDTVEVFDFVTNTWTFGAPMNEPRANHAIAAIPAEWLK